MIHLGERLKNNSIKTGESRLSLTASSKTIFSSTVYPENAQIKGRELKQEWVSGGDIIYRNSGGVGIKSQNCKFRSQTMRKMLDLHKLLGNFITHLIGTYTGRTDHKQQNSKVPHSDKFKFCSPPTDIGACNWNHYFTRLVSWQNQLQTKHWHSIS